MFSIYNNWRRRRIVSKSRTTDEQWLRAFHVLPLLGYLTDDEKVRLKELAILFLHDKSLEGAQNLDVSHHMSLVVALQACLPILNLGIEWYQGWVSVIIYPAAFIPARTYFDESGVQHQSQSVLSGESWHRGPVILSWEDTEHSGIIDGSNLVIHEFVHKLDMLNGTANGFPPLHKDMSKVKWAETLTLAFEDFQNRLHGIDSAPIDSYAATSPAEFFAVFSEVFFERPDILFRYYPEVYRQFSQFYRQDTIARYSTGSTTIHPVH